VSSSSNCGTAAAATVYAQDARGAVVLTQATQGYSFTAFLQGCTNSTATFSTSIYPGTYEVTVSGLFSNLPSPAYVGMSAVALP
jgi:hypothetical protein